LEADLRERLAATLPQRREFLGRVAGVRVSDSTVSRIMGAALSTIRARDAWGFFGHCGVPRPNCYDSRSSCLQ
jgi:hypothetical protein